MMTATTVDILGMPYFPGRVEGRLQRGVDGISTDCIALITQHEIASITSLPSGFIVVEAALFSHTMIALLGLGVPTVLVTAQQAISLEAVQRLCIDGVSGRITNEFDTPLATVEVKVASHVGESVLMSDGEPVNLCASVRQVSTAKLAVKHGAKAIGLVRSEFLLPEDGSVPDRSYYQDVFRELCEAAQPLPVTFRLLDVAVDKIPDWLPRPELAGRALGLQGVRLYNMDPINQVIAAQLDALADLTDAFQLRLLTPFLVRVEELEYWRRSFRQRISQAIPIGAMAETPAAVLDISQLLMHADFVAVGCNDLMQSLYAADRDQPELRHYLDPYAPLLYRLFRQVANQAGEDRREIQLCGVLPQIQGVFPVLIGLGYRSFSVDAPFIPYLADIVANTNQAECEALAEQICMARTSRQVLEILQLPTDRHLPFLY